MDKKQEAINVLKEYNQNHIIKLLEKLDEEKRNELIKQIHEIDFHQIMELYNNTKKEIEFKESKIEPLKYLDKAKEYEYKSEHPEERRLFSKIIETDRTYSKNKQNMAKLYTEKGKALVEKYGWMKFEDFCAKYGY